MNKVQTTLIFAIRNANLPMTQAITVLCEVYGKDPISILPKKYIDSLPLPLPVPDTEEGLTNLKVSDLRDILKDMNQKTSGKKSDLVKRILNPEKSRIYTESQGHGFKWEDEILTKVYKVTKKDKQTIKYTGKYDCPAELNTVTPNVNVSIKTAGGKSLDMGDVIRFYNSISQLDTEMHLNIITLFYNQVSDEIKELKDIVTVKLVSGDLKAMFGNLDLEKIKEFDAYVKSIPNGKETTETNRERKIRQKALNNISGMVKLRAKVNSKTQRRVQCSFPNFMEFVKQLDQKRVTINNGGELCGVQLTVSLQSGRRKRHTK